MLQVWCCVDKVGILSLPNPSVEKVFFLQSKKARKNFKGRAAVLNVSNDPESQFGLRFDDKRWQDNLSSLKPLGLNILLNSPCSSPVRNLRLADCTGHLSLKYNLAPVPSHRRCLCLLAKEIGFMDRVLSFFSKEQSHIARLTRFSGFPPFSSGYRAVRAKEKGAHQLLTQGTADVVIDTCSDFWDGTNLCPITAHDRRKVLDFYQRNSMSSYCIAFSYRPVSESAKDLSFEDNTKVDALLDQLHLVTDTDSYHRILGGQVFIGMVTLQYQAKKDIIPLVEDLNKAGIRFVHFSAEDELKSRVRVFGRMEQG
ncbi:predicted protein [Nematostella vectensis]|uniref:Uncharacterized protein n=1 Tax=Nematostella vectensis TaxID=45351 RepID=A7T0P2_NEMVE|nr:predicted protein [Nematostella vectensis]|eukprot:XP_001622576.1 predicted protein [Nematostella vectensis]